MKFEKVVEVKEMALLVKHLMLKHEDMGPIPALVVCGNGLPYGEWLQTRVTVYSQFCKAEMQNQGLLPHKANGKEASYFMNLLVAAHAPWVATIAPLSLPLSIRNFSLWSLPVPLRMSCRRMLAVE